MKDALITYLNTVSGLTTLVGSRIRIGFAEQSDPRPYLVIHHIDSEHAHHMTAATGKAIDRYQFDCVGSTTVQASNVAEQVRQALDGFRGVMDSVYVSMCHLDSERDDNTAPIEGLHTGIFVVQQDYRIGWTVSVPSFA